MNTSNACGGLAERPGAQLTHARSRTRTHVSRVLGGPGYLLEKQYTVDIDSHPYVTVGTQRLKSGELS